MQIRHRSAYYDAFFTEAFAIARATQPRAHWAWLAEFCRIR